MAQIALIDDEDSSARDGCHAVVMMRLIIIMMMVMSMLTLMDSADHFLHPPSKRLHVASGAPERRLAPSGADSQFPPSRVLLAPANTRQRP